LAGQSVNAVANELKRGVGTVLKIKTRAEANGTVFPELPAGRKAKIAKLEGK
jgi:transposase